LMSLPEVGHACRAGPGQDHAGRSRRAFFPTFRHMTGKSSRNIENPKPRKQASFSGSSAGI